MVGVREKHDVESKDAPQVGGSSSAQGIDAAEVESLDFSVSRRGFNPAEVRGRLQAAGSEIRRLQRLCDELTGRLTEISQVDRGDPDARRVTEMLGVEVSGVLDAAHEAATGTLQRAESEALSVSQEARAAAETVVADATAQSAELLEAARLEAEEIVEESRNHGREMVREAQTVRERILRDLARKRQTGRTQIEQLRAARDRLLEALGTVQSSLDAAVEDLVTAVPEARSAASRAGLRVSSEPVPTVDELEAEIEAGRLADHPLLSNTALPGPIGDTFTTGEMEALDHLDALSSAQGEPADAAPDAVAGGDAVEDGDAQDGDAEHGDAKHADAEHADAQDGGTQPREPEAAQSPERAVPESEVSDPAESVSAVSDPVELDPGEPESAEPYAAVSDPADPEPVAQGGDAGERAAGGGDAQSLEPESAPSLEREEPVSAVSDSVELDAVVADSGEAVSAVVDAGLPGSAEADSAVSLSANPELVETEPDDSSAETESRFGLRSTTESSADLGRGEPAVDAHDVFARLRLLRASSGLETQVSPPPQDPQRVATGADLMQDTGPSDPEEPSGSDAAGSEVPGTEAPGTETPSSEAPGSEASEQTQPDPAEEVRERAALGAARAMKRVLVEEQGSLLDGIRRSGAAAVASLGDEDRHNSYYDKAAIPALREQCITLGGTSDLDLAPALANIHVIALQPVRRRLADIAGKFDSEEDLTDAVRALYREARSRHLNEAASAASVAVEGLVTLDRAHNDSAHNGPVHNGKAGGAVRWVVSPGGTCGADCADNALAGEVAAGEKFPTGDRFPPAHPGCRCRIEVA